MASVFERLKGGFCRIQGWNYFILVRMLRWLGHGACLQVVLAAALFKIAIMLTLWQLITSVTIWSEKLLGDLLRLLEFNWTKFELVFFAPRIHMSFSG